MIAQSAILGSFAMAPVGKLAEREGFEPPIRFPVYTLSRRAVSTTHPSLRVAQLQPHPVSFPFAGLRVRISAAGSDARYRLNFRGVRFQPLTHLSASPASPVAWGC